MIFHFFFWNRHFHHFFIFLPPSERGFPRQDAPPEWCCVAFSPSMAEVDHPGGQAGQDRSEAERSWWRCGGFVGPVAQWDGILWWEFCGNFVVVLDVVDVETQAFCFFFFPNSVS